MTKYILGIEIIGSQVKIAIVRKDKHFKLIGVDKLDIPLGDAGKEVVKAWMEKNFKPGDDLTGAISVSESSLFLEKIRVPAGSTESIDEAIYWELSSVLPFSISEAVYDWKVLSEEGKSYAYVATAKADYIDNWVSLFKGVGIKIKLIEPSSSSFARLAKIDFSKRTLSLMVEENATDLVILEDKIPIFSTSVNISVTREDENRRRLRKDIVDEIAESAKKIVGYWEEKQGKKIEQATITGYIANKYYGLASAINKFLEVPVVIAKAKVIQNFTRSGFIENGIEQNMVSIASALGLMDEKLVHLNLLTYEGKKALMKERRELKTLSDISLFLKANFALIIILILSLLGFSLMKNNYQNNLKFLDERVSSHPGQEYVSKTKEYNKLLSAIDGFFANYENKTEKMNLLTNLTPQGLSFSSIEYKNTKDQEWTIKGTGSRDEIVAFYKKLVSESKATKVTMPFSNFDKADNNEFEVNIIW